MGKNHVSLKEIKQGLLQYLSTGQQPGTGFLSGVNLADIGYPGQVVPGASDLQTQLFGQAGGFANSPEAMARSGTLGNLMQAQPSFTADPALRERFIQQSVTDPSMKYFNDTVAPAIAARYGKGGNIGAAADVTAREGGALAGQLAGLRAGYLRGDEQLAAQSQDTANQLALGATGQSFQNQSGLLGMLNQFGTLQRGIQGQQNQGQLQQLLLQQPYGDPRLSMLGLLPQTTKYMPQQVGAPGSPGGSMNLLGSLMGVATGGLGGLLG